MSEESAEHHSIRVVAVTPRVHPKTIELASPYAARLIEHNGANTKDVCGLTLTFDANKGLLTAIVTRLRLDERGNGILRECTDGSSFESDTYTEAYVVSLLVIEGYRCADEDGNPA